MLDWADGRSVIFRTESRMGACAPSRNFRSGLTGTDELEKNRYRIDIYGICFSFATHCLKREYRGNLRTYVSTILKPTFPACWPWPKNFKIPPLYLLFPQIPTVFSVDRNF